MLRTARRPLFVVVVLVALLLVPVLLTPEPAGAAARYGASERQFLRLMNASRKARSRPALRSSDQAARVARNWSRRMAADGDLRHNPKVGDRLTVSWRRWGENVGWASNRARASLPVVVERLHRRFMASEGHRANVLGAYNQVGVGVAIDGDGTMWATMVFLHGPIAKRTPQRPPSGLTDISASLHRRAITTATERGLLEPCAPQRFCPHRVVRRSAMAAVVARIRDVAPSDTGHFDDVGPGANVIDALADAGVVVGCRGRRFCPASPVTRAQLATVLVRALPDLEPAGGDRFADLPDGYVHTPAINALAVAGVTRGCTTRRFCPTERITRAQLAGLIVRALDS